MSRSSSMNGAVKFLIWCILVGGFFGWWSGRQGATPKPVKSSSISQAAASPAPSPAAPEASPSPSPSPSVEASQPTGASTSSSTLTFVYSQPSTDSQSLGVLASGTPVRIIQSREDWVLIKVETFTGWVPKTQINQ